MFKLRCRRELVAQPNRRWCGRSAFHGVYHLFDFSLQSVVGDSEGRLTWIPTRFLSLSFSFCCSAAAAGTLQSVQSPLRQAACRAFIRVVASFARAPASCSKLSYVGRD